VPSVSPDPPLYVPVPIRVQSVRRAVIGER
jgi:hypothetical protein